MSLSPSLTARPARPQDAAAVADIYSQGIEERTATFETEPRTAEDIAPWFSESLGFFTVEDAAGEVAGYAVAQPYADGCCFRGIGEFSVYVRRSHRGQGVGRIAMEALIEGAREAGLWKLIARIFPENRASLALMAATGFRELGVHEKHGKLEGVWKDCVIVERLIPENLD